MTATEDSQSETGQSDQLPDAEPKVSDTAVLAAGASVLFALYEFYIRGNKDRGIFVGHWAPTILAFATYLRNRRQNQ